MRVITHKDPPPPAKPKKQLDIPMKLPRMYTEFASWWPLISAPQDYAEESQSCREILVNACKIQPNKML
jgi:hypothetical protein